MMPTHTYLGNYPNDHSSDWSDNLQGVTHDAEHWFFTQRTKILKFHATVDLASESNQAVAVATMPNELKDLDCNHFGDLDYFEWEGEGYLFIPVEGDGDACCGQLPQLAVFHNDSDLSYLGSTTLPKQKKELGSGRAGWCAINPLDNVLHSSSNVINASHPIFRYAIDFEALKNGYVVLTPRSDLLLRENNAAGDIVEIPKYIQGGAFSPNGWLYIANGGDSEDEGGGLRVFNAAGVLQDRSSLTDMPFKYEFHSGFSRYEEPEGLTYWNVDELRQTMRVPEIEGQLHAILLDNDWPSKDEIFFKHYRIDIQPGEPSP